MKFSLKMLPVLGILALLVACSSSRKTTKNYAYQYLKKPPVEELRFRVHHTSDESTTIYLGIPPSSFRADSAGYAHLSISFRLYENAKDGRRIDSAGMVTKVKLPENEQFVTISQSLKAPAGGNYLLYVYALDKLTKKLRKERVFVNKKSLFSIENYLLTNANTDDVLFNNFVPERTRMRAEYRNTTDDVVVKYYQTSRILALPPFVTNKKAEFPEQPDSTFTTSGSFTLDREGIYQVVVNDTLSLGAAVVCAGKDFPKLTKAGELIHALRYVTQNTEFQELIESSNPKAAIDSFWLNRGGSHDRGKVLIKEFYSRVQRANNHFTSWKEGWKTDRGLIFIIYGEPDQVEKSPLRERWVYINSRTTEKLGFTFEKTATPLGSYDWHLRRIPSYNHSWHKAVFEWRKGIIANKSR